MKLINRILSYLLTAMVASAVTLLLFTHFFPIQSKLDVIEYLIESRFIEEADLDSAEDAAAKAMISALGDQWSYYLTAEEYAAQKEQTENAYVGIGITVTAREEEDGFLVIAVEESGGAARAGILPGDIITAVEGESAAGITVSELRSQIRGEAGSAVSLEVRREETSLSFTVTRSKILTQVVSSQMLEGNVGLVTISNFDSRCAEESIAAIEALLAQGAQSLIFDVRNNPGGYASELVAVLDYLLPEGDLFRTVDYSGKERVDKSDEAHLELPIAVVCNESSISAAEFFPAAIQEYGAGTIVGTSTCGKGYFQYTYELPDGSAVGLSCGKYFTPNGRSLIGTGVTPDILCEVDEETALAVAYGNLAPEDDPQIQAALEALQKND